MMTQVAQRGSVAARKEGWSLPRITHNPSRRRVQSKGGVGAAGSGLLRETQGMTTRAWFSKPPLLHLRSPSCQGPLPPGCAPAPHCLLTRGTGLFQEPGKPSARSRTSANRFGPSRPRTPPSTGRRHAPATRQPSGLASGRHPGCPWTSPQTPLDVILDASGCHPRRPLPSVLPRGTVSRAGQWGSRQRGARRPHRTSLQQQTAFFSKC